MDEFAYTDSDADNLLERLVKYAEAFVGDHPQGLTVEDLVNDLVASCDPDNERRFKQHRGRILAALHQA